MRNLCYLFVIVILYSCESNLNHEYGHVYNSERIKNGIPIIEDGWTTASKKNDTIQFWGNVKEFKENGAWHHLKKITLNDSLLISEEDTYNYNVNRKEKYSLLIHYDYSAPSEWYHWSCKLIPNQNYGEEQLISLEVADSILNSWGLSRGGGN